MSNPPNIPKEVLENIGQIDTLVQEGTAHHHQGDLIRAKKIYEKILSIEPNHFDALQLLGILLAQTKNYLEAVELFSKALKINPKHPRTLNNLGIALKELKRLEEALANFDQAVALDPDYIDAYYNRGNTLRALNLFDEALISYDQAIALSPKLAMAYKNRANTLKDLNRFDEALISCDQAITFNPDSADNYYYRGNILFELKKFDKALASFDQAILFSKEGYAEASCNRGIVLKELKRPAEALASYDQAIAINPNFASAFFNRGNILQALKKTAEALASYDQAIAINPNFASAFYNRGGVMMKLKRFDEALTNFDQAITISPDYVDALSNRGIVLRELGQIDDAIDSFNQAISINPDHIESHWSSAHCNLMKGNFSVGWQLYEWRWLDRSFESKLLKTKKPAWDYQKTDRRLLIWEEQGVGDQVFFGSLLLELLEITPNLLVKIDNRLTPIFKRSFPKIKFYPHDEDVPESDYDIHLPIGALGKYFRNSNSDFLKTKNNFLISDEVQTQKIRQDLFTTKKLLCGVSWRSNNSETGAARTIPLEKLATIFDPEKISLINLQYDNIKQDINALKSSTNIDFVQYQPVDNFLNLDGFASLIDACDFIVTVDNSTIHISSALGKKSFLLLPYVADWRWLLDLQQSPWYPSLKIYRQKEINDWDSALENLKTDIENTTTNKFKS